MKNKALSRVLLFLTAAAMLLASTICVRAELTDATVKSFEKQIEEANNRINEALSQLSDIRDQRADAWVEIAKLDEIIAAQNELKRLAEQQLENIAVQISETKANIESLESKIAVQEQARLERMAYNYMEKEIDYIELIFGSKSLRDLFKRIEQIKAVAEYDKQLIKELNENKEQLEIQKEKLILAEETQSQRIAEYEQVIKDNTELSEEKLAFINALNNDETQASKVYEYYKKLDEQLNADLEEYLADLQRKSQSQYVGGNGGWPLEPGAYYHISSEQGWRVLNGVDDYHLGIDIACYNGTPIRSFNAGTVVVSTEHWSYGNYVVIDHGGGISTLYAHMSSNEVKVGDYVQAGQLIGYCGLTGNTYGYHLHFEYRINGQVQNPRNYLVFP